jgi:hypothetical protein
MKPALFLCAMLFLGTVPASAGDAKSAATNWSMNATAIEACSCPVFCQCFFNTSPAGHEMAKMGGEGDGMAMGSGDHQMAMAGHEGHAEHYCRFNNAYRVNKGSYGATKLDGAKFWVYGDLGSDFSKGETDGAVVTFDRATTQEQREGIGAILAHLYPVKWKSLTTAEGDIAWTPGTNEASATLDGGKTAEVHLKRFPGMKGEPVVIRNLTYFGAQSNDGFIVMPNVVEALHTGDKPFEFHGTNGFMITLNIDSKGSTPPASSY